MNWKNIILIITLAFILSLLDISFLGAVSISGATIVSTFVAVVIFAILNNLRSTLLFAAAASLFLTILSSLPLWIILFGFFVIPGLIIYLRRTNLPEPGVLISFFYFVIAAFLFELMFLANYKEFNIAGFNLTGSFVLINSITGVIVFYIVKRFTITTQRIKQ